MIRDLYNKIISKIHKKNINKKIEKIRNKMNKEYLLLSKEDKIKDSIFDGDLLLHLKYFKNLKSFGTDYASYDFYCSMDEENKEGIEPFEGLRVNLLEPGCGTVYVSYEEMIELYNKKKEYYFLINPDQKEEVEKYIEEFKRNANIK